MAKILLEYDADINDLTSKLKKVEVANTSVDNSAKKTGKDITDSFDKAAKSVDNASKKTSVFSNALNTAKTSAAGYSNIFASIASGIGAAFAVERVLAFASASVKAFQEAELNAKKLQTAVSVNGGLLSDFESLVEQSQILQKITIFSDDDIQKAQTLALQYGLTADQVERLIPVIADYASATGDSLTGALNNVIGGLEGNARALKKQGIQLAENVDTSEQLANITDQLSTKFKGQAEIIGETSAGAAAKLANQFDDLKENIGGFVSGFTDASATILSFILNGLEPLDDGLDSTSSKLNLTTQQLAAFGAGVLNANIALLQSNIDRLSESGGDVSKLNEQLDKLKNQTLNIEIKGITNEELQAKIKLLEEITFKTKEQSDELKTLNEEAKKRNLDILVSEKNLTDLTTAELEKRLTAIKAAAKETNSATLRDAIEAIQKELDVRKKAGEKALEQQKADAQKTREQKDKDFEQYYLQLIKDKEAIAKLDEARANNKTPEIVKAIESDTEATINALKERFIAVGDFSEDAQNKLNDTINEIVLSGLQLQLAETKAAGESTVEIEKQINDLIISSNQEKNDRLLESDQQAAEERQQLIQDIVDVSLSLEGELFNLQMAQSEARIQQLEAEKEAQLSAFDEQLSALEALNEAGAYSDRVYEAKKKDLLAQRVDAEKKADAEIRKLKREQAAADKAQAIFEIIINTAVAVSQLLANPFLAAAAGIAGALQLATVIAQPLPKFFKGTKFVERGNNKAGRDTIPAMLNEGERVVTTANNQKYWKEYEALDSGRFKQFVDKFHVAPALLEMKRKNETKQRGDMASEVGKSLFNSFAGMTAYDAERIRKKGMTINNSKELATLIAETIVEKLPKSYGKW